MTFNDTATLPVRAPFRLDHTAYALRRLAANVVDVVAPDGSYYRALRDAKGTTVVRVRQIAPDRLEVATTGAGGDRWLPAIVRMLGTQTDLSQWYEAVTHTPWLHRLSQILRGLKPPRYPSLWEACAHAVVFQQISIHAAGAIMRRAVEALGEPVVVDGIACIPFPEPDRWLQADESVLRAAGLSQNKVAHLRAVAAGIAQGAVDEAAIELLPTEQASQALREIRGIGPWSAAVILLRGLGRLDTFPLRDSGVARSMAFLAGEGADIDGLLDSLGPARGMLYYHLLLGRALPDLKLQPG
ncbi:MAG TPA: hypothetical protein VNG31_09065 [Candidatus Baltobacteraceae bacterium]|nr:hypothetical protein [Candidatus Baltobacteraceae bacterium]